VAARERCPRIVPATLCLVALSAGALPARGTSLPQDEAAIALHSYDGGGVTLQRSTLAATKALRSDTALGAHFTTEDIDDKSVDMIGAVAYSERRNEFGFGADYVHADAHLGVSYITSDQPDRGNDTFVFDLTQDFWGGMSSVRMGFSRGWDTIERADTNLSEEANHFRYRLGLQQILTPTLRIGVDYEGIASEGYLQNPYGSVRVLGASQPERYPGARTSNAVALRAAQSLYGNAALRADYRYFSDTWSISAHTVELGYSQYIRGAWLAELRYRYYTQTAASFYADNFARAYNYMARDKTLSQFSSQSVGFAVAYTLLTPRRQSTVQRATIGLSYDITRFDYDNFTDLRSGSLYGFDAHLLQVQLALWY
jgi:hypothetical protein